MVIVTGTLQARLDSIGELRQLSIEHVARSLSEEGCLAHGVSVDANDALRLVFFERWSSREALLAHFKVPASREFGTAATRLSARPPTLAIYEASEISLR